MTVLVGVRCTDGVVIGADSVATSAAGISPLINLQSNKKIRVFQNNVILATTGAVGLSQRLILHVDQAITGGVFKGDYNACFANIPKRLFTDLGNSSHPHHPQHGLMFGALMACCVKGVPYLVEYDSVNFQPEIKKDKLFFVTMGSGQVLADPFLAFVARVLWKGAMPSVEEGKFGVYWTLRHTINLAPGGVGEPICIAVLRSRGGNWEIEESEDSPEQAQYVSEIESHIGQFNRQAPGDAVPQAVPTFSST